MAGAVIVISSHVARGSVGNRAMVFALERLGFEVWAVPTVVLPHHPGHGPVDRIVLDEEAFAGLLQRLVANARAAGVAGIISGYLASPAQAEAVAALVAAVKAARPEALYLCDPVIGDAEPGQPGRLYVADVLAHAVRDLILPLADAATPNAFECVWLSGQDPADLAHAAAGLPPDAVLVTSAPALLRGQHGNLLVEADAVTSLEHPTLLTRVKGTGDLLAALLLARRLEGHSWAKAAELSLSSVFEVLAGSAKAGADEMLLAAFQHALFRPQAPVNVRRLRGRSPGPEAETAIS
jgi:pyridoxine kinase